MAALFIWPWLLLGVYIGPVDVVSSRQSDAKETENMLEYKLGMLSGGPSPVADGIEWASVYWTVGGAPKGSTFCGVSDPPCSGWGVCFVLDTGEPSTVTLYAPWTMRSWTVPRDCHEAQSLRSATGGFTDETRARMREVLPMYWAAHKLRGWASDFATAERVFKAVGAVVPEQEEWAKLAPSAVTDKAKTPFDYAVTPDNADGSTVGGPRRRKKTAPAKTALGISKPVKADSRKGQVLRYFLDEGPTAPLPPLMEQLGVTRSNALSQLYLLRKDHGVDYSIDGDSVTVVVPDGELFL